MKGQQIQERLPLPYGSLIDRNTEVSFSFERNAYQGFAGDSIASALAANQQWLAEPLI